jgi:hypothetical protein
MDWIGLGLGLAWSLWRFIGGWANFGEWDACLTGRLLPLAVVVAWLQGAASVSAGHDRGARPRSTALSWRSGRVPEGLAAISYRAGGRDLKKDAAFEV